MSVTDIPGPTDSAFRQAVRWATAHHRFFTENVARYGSPFRMRVPFRYRSGITVFATQSAARQILRMPAEEARGGEAYELLRESSGPTSVIVRDGAEHLRLRKLLLPPLHGERLQQWAGFVEEMTHSEMESWPLGEPFPLRPVTERITMAVIMKIVFGVRDADREGELRRLLPILFDIPLLAAPGYFTRLAQIDLGPLSPWGRFRRKRDRIDDLLAREISERRAERERPDADSGSGEDVLSMLLGVRDEQGRPLTDRELRDQLVTMLVAGHETTATSLAWAVERLLREPEVLKRLIASLEADESSYLDAVIKETLRIRPVVAQIGRVIASDSVIDGWSVPAGTLVIVPITVLHADPDAFPDPDAFRPARFLGDGNAGEYAWLPFGGGVKRCPGASLALLEMRVVLRTVLLNARLAPDRPEPEHPRVRGITLVPDRGGRVVLVERREGRSGSSAVEAAA